MLLHIQNLVIWQCFLLYIDLEHWKWNRVTDCGLLPHPIAGQPGIFRLIPSLARKTHHSTVSWRQVGWHPAMNTRACFCSNIKKNKTHFRLDSNQHLRITSSAFYHWTTCPGWHNLDCSQCLFMERDTGVAPVTSPWQGDELLLHQTRIDWPD